LPMVSWNTSSSKLTWACLVFRGWGVPCELQGVAGGGRGVQGGGGPAALAALQPPAGAPKQPAARRGLLQRRDDAGERAGQVQAAPLAGRAGGRRARRAPAAWT
jgi:hypothetical protein